MPFNKVNGSNNRHQVRVYALSTCGWCRRLKDLLNSNSIEYEFIDVDLTSGEEREEVISQIQRLNPRLSFPTIQIDGEVIVGYDENKIRALLEI